MIAVLVGHENQIRLRQLAVIALTQYRVHVHYRLPELEHQ